MKKKAYIIMAAMVIALSAAACSAKPDNGAVNEQQTGQTTQAGQTAGTGNSSAAAGTDSGMTAGNDSAAGSTSHSAQADGEKNGSSQSSVANDSSSGTLTGIVEENKGFMITIDTGTSKKDSQAYIFPLDDKQSKAYSGIKAGDKVTVSYTNGIPTPDNLDTVVTDIQVVK